jgi:hypothetical protein
LYIWQIIKPISRKSVNIIGEICKIDKNLVGEKVFQEFLTCNAVETHLPRLLLASYRGWITSSCWYCCIYKENLKTLAIMKFINGNGLEIAIVPGLASAKGVKANGDELVVDFIDERADSINYLFELDIFELEKLVVKKNREKDNLPE